jgi:hypothetical protein
MDQHQEQNALESKTATFVKDLTGFSGSAKLYRLDPPLDGERFVVVSATDVMRSGPETYIFPADAEGEVSSWGELAGSFRGGLDHAEALRGAGYEASA